MLFVLSLALVGLFLIYLEFFLPGAVMAIGGSVLLIASIAMFHVEKPNLLLLMLYVTSLGISVYFLARFAMWRIRSSTQKGSVVLSTDQEGYRACIYPKDLIGKWALAATDLKPSGQIIIEGQLLQAQSESGFIDKDTDVMIIGGQGSHLIVTTRTV